MKAFIRNFAVVTTFFLLLTGCGGEGESSSAGAGNSAALESVTFRLAWVHDMAEVGIFVAKEQGYFEKEGLDVTIEPGGFGLDPIKLVATGTNDYGIGGAGNLLLARAQGVPLLAIGAEFQNTPVGFVTLKDSGITSFRDFKGKRVGIQTGADTDVLYRALLAKNTMTSEDVKEVPIQYDMGPFVNGGIDVLPAYVTNQPITLQSKGFETNVITAASQGLNYYGNVFFTTEKTVKENPEQAARFMRAVRSGWKHALANKADAIAALRKYTQEFDPKDLEQIYDAVMPFIKPDESGVPLLGMTLARWENTAEVIRDAGLLKGPLDPATAFTDEFVR
uniref:Thiamine pyrimidine synthase n=1 Tax=Candidatus Kentrum sp. DK TaxID=2126562 RepID=A0A450SRI7_9GAMM|nr:MAG: ABC-type nitrate/sulfonate/bicarbonate transport system, substrate-binding protein [Candidatus Kentron sp. DK]